MMNFNFIASNRLELDDFKDIEKFVDSYPDFQTVFLKDEFELNMLLQLIGIEKIIPQELNGSEFSKYWDLSNFKLPEFNEEQFDQFHKKWLEESCRENNMDEYGNLIFLQGLSKQWNKMRHRLIVKEN
jgi:hypothetical protein